jgi:hypothetical protein
VTQAAAVAGDGIVSLGAAHIVQQPQIRASCRLWY